MRDVGLAQGGSSRVDRLTVFWNKGCRTWMEEGNMRTIKWNMPQMEKSQGRSHLGEEKPEFSCEHVKFEMLLGDPSGDVGSWNVLSSAKDTQMQRTWSSP